MPRLLIVGGGLFGSLAAAWARHRGLAAVVFDPGRPGAASPAAAGLFRESWAGKKFQEHYRQALPLLEQLYELRTVSLRREDDSKETLLCVPPRVILEPHPVRETVTAVGDGWLEAGGQRHEGWVYIAAGVWCTTFCPELVVTGKSGAAFLFPGEQEGRIQALAPSGQAIAFVRDPGSMWFGDGTAEVSYTAAHEQRSLERAASLGLTTAPVQRLWGTRPYTPGGPVFRRLGQRTWLATGGRKLGTLLGAALARRLVEEELRG